MLVLSRRTSERIRIGQDITITIVRIQGQQVRIGIEAPREVPVAREELLPRASSSPSSSEDAA